MKRILSAQISPFYLSEGQYLTLRTMNTVTSQVVRVRGRILRLNGDVENIDLATAALLADRSVVETNLSLGAGYLLGLSITSGVSPTRRGQTYCAASLRYGSTGLIVQSVCSGYVHDSRPLALGDFEDSVSGPGYLRSITGTDPAPGQEISETVPTNARWKLHTLHFTRTNDATAASRWTILLFDNGSNIYARVIELSRTEVAGLTYGFVYASRIGDRRGGWDSTWSQHALPDIVLLQGHRFRTTTGGMQLGDDYSAPMYLVEEWLED